MRPVLAVRLIASSALVPTLLLFVAVACSRIFSPLQASYYRIPRGFLLKGLWNQLHATGPTVAEPTTRNPRNQGHGDKRFSPSSRGQRNQLHVLPCWEVHRPHPLRHRRWRRPQHQATLVGIDSCFRVGHPHLPELLKEKLAELPNQAKALPELLAQGRPREELPGGRGPV